MLNIFINSQSVLSIMKIKNNNRNGVYEQQALTSKQNNIP